METDEFRKRTSERIRAEFGEEYSNALQVPEIRERGRRKRRIEHGHPDWSNWEKGRETHRRRFGTDTVFQTEKFRSEMRSRVAEISAKRAASFVEKYGTPFPYPARYEYMGERFDSAAELAFFVYSRDNGADIWRNSGEWRFEYEYGGKRRAYFPDFRVGDTFVEIKGDQFFRPDGTMFCPYRGKGMSDEEYAKLCGAFEAKRVCMLENGVRIIKYSECTEYFRYIDGVYGKNWIDGFKKTRPFG